jgi:hypothetical protein
MCPSNPFEPSTDFAIGNLTDCNNLELNAITVARHEITEYDYCQMVLHFFGKPDVPTKSYAMSGFDLKSVNDCSAFCIQFDPDDINRTDNTGITVELGPYRNFNRFSVQLFKGLVRVFGVDRLEFSKGIDTDNQVLVVFKAFRGATCVYFGDISSRWPNE